jgi:ABC-type lipoprotein release transport system permease subunit
LIASFAGLALLLASIGMYGVISYLGIAIGLPAALAVTRMMVRFLFGVQPLDPLTFATVPILLLVIALLACYIPARRAVRVDPMIVLRHE